MDEYCSMAEVNRLIVEDLVQAYKDQFGDELWIENLTRNLRPSPNLIIAAKYGVSKNRVIKLKHELWKMGVMMRGVRNMPEEG